MPDGSAFPRLLSRHEVAAHFVIVDAIRDARDHCITYSTLLQRTQPALETFAPRCNCSRVLSWSPWIDGMRAARCQCGAWFREVC